SFRLMIGIGLLAGVLALVMLWSLRRGRTPRSRWLLRAAIVIPFLPLVASALGWIFTEMGRQPWLVFGQLKTSAGVSANSAGEVLASMIILTLLYGGLAVIEVGLMLRYAKAGLITEPPPGTPSGDDQPLEL